MVTFFKKKTNKKNKNPEHNVPTLIKINKKLENYPPKIFLNLKLKILKRLRILFQQKLKKYKKLNSTF